MFYKWFIQLILCVHWFNPFVYWLAGEIGNACELACDEAVAAGLDAAGKKAYGNTLLAFLQTKNNYKSSAPYVTLSEGAKGLKERLGTIMKCRKKTKKVTWFTAAATVVICICFTALGAYAKASEEDNFVNSSNDSDKKDPSNNDRDFKDNVFSCEYDNGIYYIYADGTNQNDKPVCGFTDGAMGIVLVRKNGYISLGPFEMTDADRFREEIMQICEDMVESKKMTQEHADLILDIAEDIYEKEMQLNFGPSIVRKIP